MTSADCSVDGCDRPGKKRGWCLMHYQRWLRRGETGDASEMRFATSERSFERRTERRGDCLIWTGATYTNGYGEISVAGKPMPVHRFAWERANGPIPRGMLVDHRDHCDILCVEVSHLRLVDRARNGMNRSGPTAANRSTGRRNVEARNGKFRVMLKRGGKKYYFGTYDSVEEAASAASEARNELFGEYAGRG